MSKATFIRGVERTMARRVRHAANLLENEATKAFSRKQGTPSKPGEYPAKQTGKLVGSVEITEEDGGLTADIGPRAEYADDLADMGRKMMGSVFAENRTSVERIMSGS